MVESTFNKVAGITVIFDLFCFTVFIVEFDRVFSCRDKIFGQKISTISTISGVNLGCSCFRFLKSKESLGVNFKSDSHLPKNDLLFVSLKAL